MSAQASIFRPELFAGRSALVTGGSRGIGLAIARELKSLGANVFIGSRRREHVAAGLQALDEIAAGQAAGQVFDIRDEESLVRALDACRERFGPLELLVNNAGGQFPAPALQMSRKGFDTVIATNLNATFHVTRTVVADYLSERGGAVVNITAQVANGFPMMAHTGAARAGVENLTRTLALELAPLRVRVNAVAPGVIHSSGVKNYAPEFQAAFLSAGEHIPAGRLGSEREVAAAVVFLLSPAASFITGAVLRVDGGEPLLGSAAAALWRGQINWSPFDRYD